MTEQNSHDRSEPITLSPAAMDLAHTIGLFEDELRAVGRSTERINFLRGRVFGLRIMRLAMRDGTATNIYRPEEDGPDVDTHAAVVPRSAADRRVMDWGQAADASNRADETSDARSSAFKDD